MSSRFAPPGHHGRSDDGLCRVRRGGRLSELFQGPEGPSPAGKIAYPLDEIFLLCLLAVLAGAEIFVDIALFGCKKLGAPAPFPPVQRRHAGA